MKVSLVQTSIKWLDSMHNRSIAEQLLDKHAGSDIYFFAEMFTTGFCMSPKDCAESGEETLTWLKKMAIERGVAIGGSVSVQENGKYYNRFYVVKSDGSYVEYNKRHLFSFAGEDKSYEAGQERVIVEVGGVRILLQVCYDLRFPVWSRNRGDYDAMVCVANWPTPRRFVWDTLLRARALENQAYACGVNIVGCDPTCEYSGGTAAVDFLGGTIGQVPDKEEGVVSFEIDIKALNEFRDKFPALNDADNFTLKI